MGKKIRGFSDGDTIVVKDCAEDIFWWIASYKGEFYTLSLTCSSGLIKITDTMGNSYHFEDYILSAFRHAEGIEEVLFG